MAVSEYADKTPSYEWTLELYKQSALRGILKSRAAEKSEKTTELEAV